MATPAQNQEDPEAEVLGEGNADEAEQDEKFNEGEVDPKADSKEGSGGAKDEKVNAKCWLFRDAEDEIREAEVILVVHAT
ncbi:hypothetical protein MTO96_047092 [Rhipicephalus appendiculatus]